MLTLSKVTKKKKQQIWGNSYRKRKSRQESAKSAFFTKKGNVRVCYQILTTDTHICNRKGVVLSLNCDNSASFRIKFA